MGDGSFYNSSNCKYRFEISLDDYNCAKYVNGLIYEIIGKEGRDMAHIE